MMSLTKTIATAAFALTGMAGVSGAASAGTWYLDAAACPDLREDRRDSRYFRGRADRIEDRRDRRVIDCPAYAWSYVPDRHDSRYSYYDSRFQPGARFGSPGLVYASRDGGYFIRNFRGDIRWINVVIEYPRGRPGYGHRRHHPGRGLGLGRHPY